MKFEKTSGLITLKFSSAFSIAAALMIAPGSAYSRTLLPGEVETVTSGASPESWRVPSAAILTIDNATALDISVSGGTLNTATPITSQIAASAGAQVTLAQSRVTSTGFDTALALVNSTATVTGSTLTSQGTALSLARSLATPTGSTATVTDSQLLGGSSGAAVTSLSTLNLNNTLVEGRNAGGTGLRMLGGNANVRLGSQIVGELNGVTFEQDLPAVTGVVGGLVVDGSTVQGLTGAAISVKDAVPAGQSVLIDVRNGSNLMGGNGNILEVADGASARLQVDHSALTGNIEIADGGNASVLLQNAASLKGDLINVRSVSLDAQSTLTGNIRDAADVALDNNSVFDGDVTNVRNMSISRGAHWSMANNNTLESLNVQGGTVRFGTNEAFSRLDVANLSGNGTFQMGTDLASGNTDFLNVTQSATGEHQLEVTASGNNAVDGTPVKVGNIASGDAEFALKNGQVDVGAIAYKLVKEGEGLYLQPDATSPSTGTKTAMAIAGTAPTVIYSEMTTLNTRLGDRRMAGTQPRARSADALGSETQQSAYGVWVRTSANQYNVKNAYGDGYKQNQTGVSVGVDAPLPYGDGQWLIGAFGGYSNTRLNLARGSSGSIDSVYLGAYLTWFDEATGYYIDTVAKVNRFNNDVKVTLSDDTRTKGNFDNLGLSGSVEVGKHIVMNNGYFVEPSVQLGVAAVQGKDYALDNGLTVNSDETRSLLGRVGMTVGRELVLSNGGKLQPRLLAAVSHEFVNNNRVSVNDTDFNNDLSSTSLELTGGLNWIPANNKWQLYAEVATSRGDKIDQELGGSIGLSYSF